MCIARREIQKRKQGTQKPNIPHTINSHTGRKKYRCHGAAWKRIIMYSNPPLEKVEDASNVAFIAKREIQEEEAGRTETLYTSLYQYNHTQVEKKKYRCDAVARKRSIIHFLHLKPHNKDGRWRRSPEHTYRHTPTLKEILYSSHH